MKLLLDKSGSKYFSDTEWELIRNAIKWFHNKHKLEKYHNECTITFVSNIDKTFSGVPSNGLLRAVSLPEISVGYPMGYMFYKGTIYISAHVHGTNKRRTLAEIINTLFHECIHLRQYLSRELVDAGQNSFIYKGKHFKLSNTFDLKEYYDWPWEQEAHTYSEKYLYEFLENGNKKEEIAPKKGLLYYIILGLVGLGLTFLK